MSRKRKNPPGPVEEPPFKKRSIIEALAEAPPEWRDLYEKRKLYREKLPYDLKPKFELDEKSQKAIIENAKNNEILGSHYRGYCQVSDLYNPIYRFPIIVCNPFIKIIGGVR